MKTLPLNNELIALASIPLPRKFSLVSASAEGNFSLTAFDKALLLAGVGNTNLLKVSSILPPNAEEVSSLEIPPGSLLPIAYASLVSENPGELIAASVAVGMVRKDGYGVIMEFSDKCSRKEAEQQVAEMAKEALDARGLRPERIIVAGVEHVVRKIGCVFAAVPMWY